MAHTLVRLQLANGPLAVACCSAQLQELGSLLGLPRTHAAHNKDGADALEEAQRIQSRQADVIAHLLAVNDELTASNCELREANAALASALERHAAVVSTLASENAAMLEHAERRTPHA
jgi:hypothetical protein